MTVVADPTLLTGWGHTAPSAAEVRPGGTDAELLASLTASPPRGVLARGLGRSYGDTAQNAGGTVLDMTTRSRILDVDLERAVVEVEAGVSLDRLLRTLLPLGLTLPVQPGTRQVTVGGAIACDIHGKNHHRVGSFGSVVESMVLLTPAGAVHELDPDGPERELFWATVGGLGLTGVVVRARLRMRPVETSYVVVETERCPDLLTVMQRLRERDRTAEYTVAWFDSVTTGRGAGRGVVMSGRDARLGDLDGPHGRDPLHVPPHRTLRVPTLPTSVVTRASGRVFNELWFRRAPRRPAPEVQHCFGFFQPLDGVEDWFHLYGARGLVQYQLVVPDEAERTVLEVVRAIAASGHVSCLNVLKRFGAAGRGLLSFPAPGWTLAVDLPLRPGLAELLDRLDRLVLEAGGRVYLAKDPRLSARDFATMYPQAARFDAVRRGVDPDGVLRSDLSRRLSLAPGPRASGVSRAGGQ